MTSINIQQFQGTSEEEDFQSALLEAINKALEALSVGTSDQRIAWKLIEISGSRGGLLGEKTITVTIEAQPH
jgi:predicted dehydrogenase